MMSNEILNEILIRSSSLVLRCTPCISHPGNNNIIPDVDGYTIFDPPIKFPFIFDLKSFVVLIYGFGVSKYIRDFISEDL